MINNDTISVPIYRKDGLIMAQTQLSKEIKKLNERIADFERNGLTESSQYKTLISQVHAIGVPVNTTKSGHTAIKNTKKMTEEQIAKLSKMAQGKNTKGRAVKQAKELLKQEGIEKPTQEQIQETLKIVDDVHEAITQHANEVYSLEMNKNSENYVQIHGNNGRFTLSEMKKILDEVNKSEIQRREDAEMYLEYVREQEYQKQVFQRYEQDKIIADKYNTTVETYRKATDFIDTLSPWQVATYKWDIKDVIRAMDNGTFEEFKRQIML